MTLRRLVWNVLYLGHGRYIQHQSAKRLLRRCLNDLVHDNRLSRGRKTVIMNLFDRYQNGINRGISQGFFFGISGFINRVIKIKSLVDLNKTLGSLPNPVGAVQNARRTTLWLELDAMQEYEFLVILYNSGILIGLIIFFYFFFGGFSIFSVTCFSFVLFIWINWCY